MDFNKLVILARAFCLGLILSVFASPTWAVHDLGTFELEGNATDDAVAGDDWENIYDGSDSANVDTGILPDPSPISIFTGGRKDIQDISEWSHKDGSVPDKDDLTNAYAAAYGVDNGGGGSDLVIYFGADRFANVGDAFMGFWFFQDDVQALDDGSFSGQHVVGDVLVLIDYPQGANDEPYAALVTWDQPVQKRTVMTLPLAIVQPKTYAYKRKPVVQTLLTVLLSMMVTLVVQPPTKVKHQSHHLGHTLQKTAQ